MSLSADQPILLKVLTPLARAADIMYGNRRRPWSAGYKFRLRAEGAQSVYGVNHPGELSPRVCVMRSNMNTATTTPFTYTPPAAFTTAYPIPADTNMVAAATLLNAIMLMYADKDQANAVIVKRYGRGVAAPTTDVPYWQEIAGGTTFKFAYSYSAPNYSDLPANFNLALIIPDAATIALIQAAAAAGESLGTVMDFMAAGAVSSALTPIAMDRVFQ